MSINIAIDGPAGAGKSTMARHLAQKLGYLYVDTGALYRAVGLAVRRAELDPSEETAVAALLPALRLRLGLENGVQQVYLEDENVSAAIRLPEIGDYASRVSALPAVRAFLLDTQREIAARENVVMDGRDIGTVVLPGAQVKVFLTASAEVRARRRFLELEEKGTPQPYETVLEEMRQRDERDYNRPIAPLRQAEDAVLLDSSKLNREETEAALLAVVQEALHVV